ncbi:hypothetical protein IFM89_006233 [Coptis chinensis]|uniref:Uncharacterized protein n=1 Tax=Coptis chinensis TaxID=261450 RepID=A0A835MBU7_9MAGN|nr:hypothetical protein IFM89_006233 [Coptis chinensis]
MLPCLYWLVLTHFLSEAAAIFVSVYEEGMDLLRAVIIGTPGTPYHDVTNLLCISYKCLQPKVRALIVEGNKTLSLYSQIRYSSSRFSNESSLISSRLFSSKSPTSFCTWRSTLYGHRSLNKGFPSRSSRNISTTGTISSSSKEGSKMLVTACSHAQKLVGIWIFGSAAWNVGKGIRCNVCFAIFNSYFLRKGYITVRLGVRLSALFALGASQGLIGWWMVKSGLEEPESEYVQPRESPYRLATHLTSKICNILWPSLDWSFSCEARTTCRLYGLGSWGS